jgi:hypothetical protein
MNPTLRLPRERVAALQPADLEAYLLAHGWEEDDAASSAQAGAFRYRRQPDVTVLVPRDRDVLDYAVRVGDVLQTLAVVERRPAWEVLDNLSASRPPSLPNGAPAANPRARGKDETKGRESK